MIIPQIILDHLLLWGAFFLTGTVLGFFFSYIVVTSTEKKL